MAKAVFWHKGESLDYKNSTSAEIKANDIISLTTRIGVAGTDIPAGKVGSVITEGVFKLPKTGTAAINIGALVYFDVEDGGIDADKTNVPAGYAAESAAAADTTILVKLLG